MSNLQTFEYASFIHLIIRIFEYIRICTLVGSSMISASKWPMLKQNPSINGWDTGSHLWWMFQDECSQMTKKNVFRYIYLDQNRINSNTLIIRIVRASQLNSRILQFCDVKKIFWHFSFIKCTQLISRTLKNQLIHAVKMAGVK